VIQSKAILLGHALLLFFWLGYLNTILHMPENDDRHLVHLDLDDKNLLDIKAEVVEVLKDNQFSNKYFLKGLSINSKAYNGKVLLQVNKSDETKTLEVGDQIQLFSRLEAINASKNPQAFNYGGYLKNKNVYAQINEKSYVVSHKNSKSILALAYSLRNDIADNLDTSGFKDQHLQLIQALILGQKKDIDRQMYAQFAEVGIVHILAVSGLHVGLIFLILGHLLKPLLVLKYGIWLRVLLIVLLLWVFAFIVGFSPSVVRAVTMFSCFALSDLLQRRTNSINVLLLSALILLLLNPNLLFEVGFQLSYAAVFSIVSLYPVMSKLYYPKYQLVKLFTDTVFVSLAAQIGVLPFQLLYFHQFPTLFLFGNIVVIPFLGILISGGLICVLLSALNVLWYPVLWIYSKLLDGLIMYVDWLSNFKGLVLKDIYFTQTMGVVLVLLVLSFIFMLRQFKTSSVITFLLLGASFAVIVIKENLKVMGTSELIIFHKYKSSVLGIKSKDDLLVFTNDTNLDANTFILQNYKVLKAIDEIKIHKLPNELFFGNTKLIVIDSLGVYRDTPENKIVVLSHSPDIHFEKLLKSQNISCIIADGSNYRSYAERWQETSAQYSIPFHSTYSQGYYAIKSD
jgi:competence protein ComEC